MAQVDILFSRFRYVDRPILSKMAEQSQNQPVALCLRASIIRVSYRDGEFAKTNGIKISCL